MRHRLTARRTIHTLVAVALLLMLPTPADASGPAPTITSVKRTVVGINDNIVNPGGEVFPMVTGPTSGGAVIVLSGSGFESPTVVRVGGTVAPTVRWESSTQIRAITPPGTAGAAVEVVVENPDGETATKAAVFTYANEREPAVVDLQASNSLTPSALTVSPDSKWLYVSNYNNVLTVLDALSSPHSDTPTVVETFTLARRTDDLRLSRNGSRLYVNTPTAGSFYTFSITGPMGETRTLTETTTLSGFEDLAVSPDSQRMYTASSSGNVIRAVDLSSAAEVDSVTVDITPLRLGIHPGGRYLYVTSKWTNLLNILDTDSMTVVANVTLAARPDRIAFTPDGSRAFVSLQESGTVSVLRLTDGLPYETGTITGLPGASVLATTPDNLHVYVGSFTQNAIWKIRIATEQVVDAIATPWDPNADFVFSGIEVSPNGNFTYAVWQSLSKLYAFRNPPSITTVSPSSGPTAGGTSVQITGFGFDSATAVYFGSETATFTVDSATQITAVTPAVANSEVDVIVVGPGGSDTRTGSFVFADTPTVTSVSPATGTTAGGTSVQINGTNFYGVNSVTFGGVSAGFSVMSATQISANAPAGSAGAVDIVVTGLRGTGTKTAAFTYVAPTPPTPPASSASSGGGGLVASLSAITPNTGTTAGGTQVTITGSNLGSVNGVTFNGVAATSLTIVDGTRITAVTPAGVAGPANVMVSMPGSTASFGAVFTYVAPTPPTTDTSSGSTTSGGTTTGGGSTTTPAAPTIRTNALLATFATKSSLLSAADRKTIQRLVTTSGMDARYRIKGFSTSSASAQTLARARARAIQRFLIELGVIYSRISTEYNSKVAKQVQLVAITQG